MASGQMVNIYIIPYFWIKINLISYFSLKNYYQDYAKSDE